MGLLKNPVIAVQPANHPGVKPAKAVWRGTNALPSWSWRGCEGNRTVVEVYASASTAAVELYLNKKMLGRKKVKDCRAQFSTKYAPGVLKAVALDAQGNRIGESELHSAAGTPAIRVLAESGKVRKGEAAYIDVAIVGANGVVEANADARLTVSVEGGELLAFGSANPRTEERYESGSFTTYYGRAQAVVRAHESGAVAVTVGGAGFAAATAKLMVE